MLPPVERRPVERSPHTPHTGPDDIAHAARYAGLKGDMCAITERWWFPIPA